MNPLAGVRGSGFLPLEGLGCQSLLSADSVLGPQDRLARVRCVPVPDPEADTACIRLRATK